MTDTKRTVLQMDDEQLREWADEHLRYEVENLVYSAKILAAGPQGLLDNLALESFLVHARCLNDFLWHDPSNHHTKLDDVFALDFCDELLWKEERKAIAQVYLDQARDQKRFGGEIMHLTTRRIAGFGEGKEWPFQGITREILLALEAFAQVAPEPKLPPGLRSILLGGKSQPLGGLDLVPTRFTAGTAVATSSWAGGRWQGPET